MKSSLAQIHITMCMYVFSLILLPASDEMNFIIIANLVKVSEDARDAGEKLIP